MPVITGTVGPLNAEDRIGERPMLKQHKFYVYNDGTKVMARMENEKPVVAETLKTPQEAADRVQEIVNPNGIKAAELGRMGYHDGAFQAAIAGNSEKYVKSAYRRAARKD